MMEGNRSDAATPDRPLAYRLRKCSTIEIVEYTAPGTARTRAITARVSIALSLLTVAGPIPGHTSMLHKSLV